MTERALARPPLLLATLPVRLAPRVTGGRQPAAPTASCAARGVAAP